MVKIVGNVKPEDDYTHPLGPEQNFNESVYFNFFDRAQNRGGFLRIGNRANEGHAEMTVIVYNAGRLGALQLQAAGDHLERRLERGRAARSTVLVPGEKLRTTLRGLGRLPRRPARDAGPRQGVQGEPAQAARARPGARRRRPDLRPRRQARRRQRLRARALRAAHEGVAARSRSRASPRIELSGHGLRDHSWGPRYWQSTPSYRWITGNFGDDLGMVISIVGDRVGGVFHKGEELLPHHRGRARDRLRGRHATTTRALRAKVTLADGAKHRDRGPRARLHPAAQPPRRHRTRTSARA